MVIKLYYIPRDFGKTFTRKVAVYGDLSELLNAKKTLEMAGIGSRFKSRMSGILIVDSYYVKTVKTILRQK